MTTQDIIEEVFETLGEPTDLEINATPGDPSTFSIALAGSQRILRVVNQALVRIANWRYRDGRILRMRPLYSQMLWKNAGPLVVTASGGTASTVEFPAFTNPVTDQFAGWWAEITDGTGVGQKRMVISDTSAGGTTTANVASDWGTNPDATSKITFRKNFAALVSPSLAGDVYGYHVKLDPAVGVGDILRIRDVVDNVDLGRSYVGETYTGGSMEVGIPAEFAMYGNRIVFDVSVDESRSYELLYYRNPIAVAAGADVPEIPVAFHDAITLYAIHKLQLRAQDYDGQYVTKRNLSDMMEELRLVGTMSYEMDNMSIVVWG